MFESLELWILGCLIFWNFGFLFVFVFWNFVFCFCFVFLDLCDSGAKKKTSHNPVTS